MNSLSIFLISVVLLLVGVVFFQFLVIRGSRLKNDFLEERNSGLLNDLLEAKKPTLQMRPLSGKHSHLAAKVRITSEGYLAVPMNPDDRTIEQIRRLDQNIIDGFSPLAGQEITGLDPKFSSLLVLGAEYRYKKGQEW